MLILNQTMKQGTDLFGARGDNLSGKQESFAAEDGARRFAATFLMPRKSVLDTASQLGLQKRFWSFELLLRIKHRFGVSAEAFLYRLGELDLIDPALMEPLKEKIYEHYEKTGFGEPDFSRRLLTPMAGCGTSYSRQDRS